MRIAAENFERFSFDLIYARPDQTPAAWAAELETAIGHAVEHLSLYQLTIEPGTWFERLHAAGKLVLPDHDAARALYDVTQEICERRGLPAYEISNHARPGAQSRHNLVYWRYGEYVGIGPGAHGRIVTDTGRITTATERHPETWAAAVESCGHGIVESAGLTPEEEADEFLLMGLRLREGIDPAPLRGARRPRARRAPDWRPHGRGADRPPDRRPPRRDAGGLPGARRGRCRSRGLKPPGSRRRVAPIGGEVLVNQRTTGCGVFHGAVVVFAHAAAGAFGGGSSRRRPRHSGSGGLAATRKGRCRRRRSCAR